MGNALVARFVILVVADLGLSGSECLFEVRGMWHDKAERGDVVAVLDVG